MRFCLILITALLLAGCSHHKAPPPNARLSDSITVIAGLNDQLQSWHGTPYRYGGMTRRGVDCSERGTENGNRPAGLKSPNKTSAMAIPPSCPG